MSSLHLPHAGSKLGRVTELIYSLLLLLILFPTRGFSQAPAQSPAKAGPPIARTEQEPAVKPAEQPRSPREAAELRADILKARKLYPDAIAMYEDLLKKEPKNAELHNKIGVCYSQMTKLEQAKKSYERAIKLNPNFAEAVNNLATVHYYQKRYRRAVKLYQRSISIQPEAAIFRANLGYAYFGDKKYDLAMESFQQALQLDATIFEQRGGGGGSVLTTRSPEERARFFFFLAKAHATLGNAERCAHFLKRAIEEGYKDIAAVEKDPGFAKVINDPQVKEILHPPPAAGTAGKPVS